MDNDRRGGRRRRAVCVNSLGLKACKFVQGDISPNGWCRFCPQKT